MGSVTHLFSATGNEGELEWDFSTEQYENCTSEVTVKASFRISVFPGILPKLDEMRDRKIISGYEI
jgi:hypothetical protein